MNALQPLQALALTAVWSLLDEKCQGLFIFLEGPLLLRLVTRDIRPVCPILSTSGFGFSPAWRTRCQHGPRFFAITNPQVEHQDIYMLSMRCFTRMRSGNRSMIRARLALYVPSATPSEPAP